ncbi:MAG: O-antigen ligase family protein [candidate division KSB1 bacterium]|nr:O-antigen ligase family protein [candidate division KSB1 bacterium]MDZ7368412.1 O-antigen ligase family protein [candidate division KSB1 bacterium]
MEIRAERAAYVFFIIMLAFSQISIAGTQIALSFCILFFLIYWQHERPRLPGSGSEAPYAALILILLVASILSARPWTSLFNLRKLGLIVMLYLTLWLINSRPRLLTAHIVLLFSLAAMSLFEIIRSGLADSRLRWATHGITVTYGVVIMMSLLMLLSVRSALRPLLHACGLPKLFLEKYYFALLLLVIIIAFVLAGVRSAFVGFAAGLFCLAILKERRLLLYFMLVVAFAFILGPPNLQERLAAIFKVRGDLSNEGRVLLWQTGWRIFLAKPWLGWGWRDLVVVYPDFAPAGADLTKHPFHIGHVHNNFLQMAIIAGAFGLAAFIWLLFVIGRKLYLVFRQLSNSYLRDTALGAFCAFVGYLVASQFDWSFGDEEITMALWLIVGLGFAAERLAKTEQQDCDLVLGT